jgi:outer membrane biosynthesis protein TonB
MALIKLLADPEDDGTLPPPPPLLRGADFPIDDLLLELAHDRRRAKGREAGWLSIIGHLLVLLLILLSPKLFQQAYVQLPPQREQQTHEQLQYLELPKDLITKKKPVQPKALSDRSRHFDHPTPLRDSISAPANRPAPVPRPATPPPGPPAPAPRPAAPPPAAKAAAPRPAPAAQPKAEAGLRLENVPKPTAKPNLNLSIDPADSLRRAIEGAARDQMNRGQSMSEVAPLPQPSGAGSAAPGSTGAGVRILTDTQGVNFDPYLRRIIEIVRRNWYAVMPETVYLGTQGKVVIVFNINANGGVPGLRPLRLARTASLNQAAEASITASNPFPPLPTEFHGPFITLEFSFYYNLSPGGK